MAKKKEIDIPASDVELNVVGEVDAKEVATTEVAKTEEVATTKEVETTEASTLEVATTGELGSESEESEESNLDIAEQMVSATKEFYMGIFGELTGSMFEPLEQVIKEARFKSGEIDGTENVASKEDVADWVQSNLDKANEALAKLNSK